MDEIPWHTQNNKAYAKVIAAAAFVKLTSRYKFSSFKLETPLEVTNFTKLQRIARWLAICPKN